MARSSGAAAGALLLAGGGWLGPEIAAAAALWVVVPTAASDDDVAQAARENFVVDLGRRFAVLHTRDRAVADTEAFVAPLLKADAVWFEGGRQTRLMDAYAGTRTESTLRAVLDRSGLMAGTSADTPCWSAASRPGSWQPREPGLPVRRHVGEPPELAQRPVS